MTAEQIQGHDLPFIFSGNTHEVRNGLMLPHGTRIDNPINLTLDDWQEEINKFSLTFPTVPEGFLQSAYLTYSAARGIEVVYPEPDPDDIRTPRLTIYAERTPGMLKNFFSATDRSIYFHANWLAKRAQLPQNEERKFFTEKNNEILFEGTPSAYATLIAMEEAQHALDFQQGILKPSESEGMQYRSEKLVEHDSKKGELRALHQSLERMQRMPQIFSNSSIMSIENRIINAEKYQSKHTFFLSRFFSKT